MASLGIAWYNDVPARELLGICVTTFVDVHTSFVGAYVGIMAGGAATTIADAAIQGARAMSEVACNLEGSATAILNESAAMV